MWGDTEQVMHIRNVVAHNPITRVRIDRAEGHEESTIAVVDMALSKPQEIQHLDATKIANLANLAQTIVEGLFECLAAIEETSRE